MAWQKKASAPATFNLGDAFLALITGDATWGWLQDWLPLLGNDHFDTADFCAQGPTPAAQLQPADFTLETASSPFNVAGLIAQRAAAIYYAARDRVFQAYCETPDVLVAGWGAYYTGNPASTHSSFGDDQKIVVCDVPATATLCIPGIISKTGSVGNVVMYVAQNTWANPSLLILAGTAIGDDVQKSIGPAGTYKKVYAWIDGGPGSAVCRIKFNAAGPGVSHTATAQPQPAGVLSPLKTVPPTLAGIAYELEQVEFKLETLYALMQSVAGATLDLGGDAAAAANLPANTPLAVGDAVGVILTASGIPASRTLDFGTPQNVVRLAHVNFGTNTAWYPSVWMTHTPMIIRPLPPGTKQISVTSLPPGVTIQQQLIERNK